MGPRTWFPEHRHQRTKHLFVIRGRISFNGLWVEAGEGVRIPAGTDHEAVAGDAGVECVEAFETASRRARAVRRGSTAWAALID